MYDERRGNQMKNKILASLLAVCLFVGLAVPAFAVSELDENRVTKIAFDKPEYQYTDIAGISLDGLLTAYDKNNNRMMFNGDGLSDMLETVYSVDNNSILNVEGDLLVLTRNANTATKVPVTATAVTGVTAKVIINVPAGTVANNDVFAKGYTVADAKTYYLNNGLDADGTTTATANVPAEIATPALVATDLKVGDNVIKVAGKEIKFKLADQKDKTAADVKVFAANKLAIEKATFTLTTGSGRVVTFKADTAALVEGATTAWGAAAYTGVITYVAQTKDTAGELGTFSDKNITYTVAGVLDAGTIDTQFNGKTVASTGTFTNGTSNEARVVLDVKPVGGEFSAEQIAAFKFKVSSHTASNFTEITSADPTAPVVTANLEVITNGDGSISFIVDPSALAALASPEKMIGRNAYVRVYNEFFASASTFKSATISIVGETYTAPVGLPAVINVGVGQNLDLRTVATGLKDKKDGYKIAQYNNDQTLVEANRIAKVLADTNYMVRGLAQGTTTILIGEVPVKLVVGAGNMPDNTYKNPSINPIITLTVGAKYTIAVKDAGTEAPVFSSYDNKIATVDANGVVTAVAPGTIKIKVVTGPNTDNRKDLYATVTVKAAPAVVDPTVPGTGTKPPATGVSFFAL